MLPIRMWLIHLSLFISKAMPLESANYISELVETNPISGDLYSTLDDHERLIKRVLSRSFPNISGPVTVSHGILNTLSGIGGNLSPLTITTAIDTISAESVVLVTAVEKFVTDVGFINQKAGDNDVSIQQISSSYAPFQSEIDTLSAHLNVIDTIYTLPDNAYFSGVVSSNGTAIAIPSGWSSSKAGNVYQVNHFLGVNPDTISVIVDFGQVLVISDNYFKTLAFGSKLNFTLSYPL